MPDTNLPGLVPPANTPNPSVPPATPSVQAPASAPAPQAKPTGQVSSDPSGMNSDSFTGLLGSIGQKLKYNNEIATNRQSLLKHLYDSPLTPDEISKLPADIQDIVKTGNKDAMELQVRVLNDQLQGRAGTLGQTVQALTTGYQQSVSNTKNAMTEILAYAQSTGKPIADVVKALGPIYGQSITSDMMKNLEALGAPLLKTSQVAPNDYVYGSATHNVSQALGVQPTIPLKSVIEQSGIGPIVDAIIKNEGSSPKGVMNNPGNIKFSGLPGQLDSGIKASDGGTFASYGSPDEGKHAIEFIIQNAADSKSSAYGANPTLGDFMDKYTNTAPDRSVNALPPEKEKGNIPGVGGFTPNAIYQDALELMFTGKAVQSFVGGLSNSGDSKTIKADITNKAAAIATALGGSFPKFQQAYKADSSAVKQNIERMARVDSIANSVINQIPRLSKLADQIKAEGIDMTDITESDVQAGKASVLRRLGSNAAASYIELVQTIRADYAAQNAALAGSRGGEFFARTAQEAIPLGLTSDQYNILKDTMTASATNVKDGINKTVSELADKSNPSVAATGSGDGYQEYLKMMNGQ